MGRRTKRTKQLDAATMLAEQLVKMSEQVLKFAQNAQNAAIITAQDQHDRVHWELEVQKGRDLPTPEPLSRHGGRVASRTTDRMDDETPDDGFPVEFGGGYGTENGA